jgi:threo-3-hydroxy-L-aspartate ammonia-lyase
VTELVGLEAIRQAAERIRGVAVRTPLLQWDEHTWLKPESLQPIGAFKMRGAYARLATLTDAQRSGGVITYSSGNHAQAVARAARLLNLRAVIVMPEGAPAIKVAGVERDGAEIVRCGPGSDERTRLARKLADERGLTIIPPYDDDGIIAGQGTCGLEIVEDLPDVGSVLVPVGGGGLIAGVAAAVKALRPEARIIGVEPELSADGRESLQRGEIVEWSAEDVTRTMADGLRVQSLGRRPFEHMRALVEQIVTVTEDQIAEGVRRAATRARLVVEPSGAVGIAAHEFGRVAAAVGDERRVIVVSGGNLDPRRYAEILSAG